MKDITTPVPPEEMKKLVQKCLEKAAQINYSQLIEYAQIKGESLFRCQLTPTSIRFCSFTVFQNYAHFQFTDKNPGKET